MQNSGENPSSFKSNSDFHPSNLANRPHIELALYSRFNNIVLITVSGILSNTNLVEGLSSPNWRIKSKVLLSRGIVKMAIPNREIRNTRDFTEKDLFVLTEEGKELVQDAMKKPYLEVSELLVKKHESTLQELQKEIVKIESGENSKPEEDKKIYTKIGEENSFLEILKNSQLRQSLKKLYEAN